jgi:dihydroflavonol-4-reductase
LPVKIVYPAFGYGCAQAGSHPSLQDQTLLRLADGKPVAIMGSGRNRLCLVYYKDTAAGICLAHQNGKPGEGYILGNDNLTFVEIWAAVARVLGKAPPRLRVPLPILRTVSAVSGVVTGHSIFPSDFFDMVGLNWCFSHQKAREQLGWQPHPFDAGIAETWADYQAQRQSCSVRGERAV